MKKILLAAALIGVFAMPQASAQTFTTPADTVTDNYTGGGSSNYHNNITNITGSSIQVNWKVTNNDFPASWKTDAALGICDNQQCYSNLNNQLTTGTTFTTLPITASTEADFHLQLNLNGAVDGTHWMAAELKSGSQTKNVVWVISKNSTGVPSVTRSEDNVVVYPNPARSSVNVVFNGGPTVRNVAVFNLIGKMVSIYHVSGNSANIPLNDVPAGIYFLRLLDNQGQVIATRKFTRQ